MSILNRALAAILIVVPAQAAALDHTRPLFTQAGAPMCDSENDLKDLLEHVRAGVQGIQNGDYGCFAALDGWDVKVLESDGLIDRWDKISTTWAGAPRDFWAADWMLRN